MAKTTIDQPKNYRRITANVAAIGASKVSALRISGVLLLSNFDQTAEISGGMIAILLATNKSDGAWRTS